MTLKDDLSSSKWSSEVARVHVIMKLIARCPNRNDIHDLIADALLSPAFKLCNFVDVIDLLDEKSLLAYISSFSLLLSDRRRSPISDLRLMITKLTRRLPISQMANVMNACYERLLESSSILEELYNGYSGNCFNDPSMLEIKNKLEKTLVQAMRDSDWGLRDTAIEIASLVPCFRHIVGPLVPFINSDPSPYVRASALRCIMRECQEECDLIAICEKVVILDTDPEPRLVALKYLYSSLPGSIDSAYHILSAAIEDSDIDVRIEMLNICMFLLKDEKYAEETRAELLQWTEDTEIGQRVRQLLGKAPTPPSDPALHILIDMISALKINKTEGDIIDCY